MSVEWQQVTVASGHRIIEAAGVTYSKEEDLTEEYSNCYSREPNPLGIIRRQVWIDEVFSEFDSGSSLLVFGSGHSIEVNTINKELTFSQIVAMDRIEEAGEGLAPEIEFWKQDILTDDLKKDFDYIFSSHTIEHFTRNELMNIILPKCLRHARKAVVFLTPYRDIGWGLPKAEGPHLINLCEEDELTALASKWKRIRDNLAIDPPQYGIELVLWFEGEAPWQNR